MCGWGWHAQGTLSPSLIALVYIVHQKLMLRGKLSVSHCLSISASLARIFCTMYSSSDFFSTFYMQFLRWVYSLERYPYLGWSVFSRGMYMCNLSGTMWDKAVLVVAFIIGENMGQKLLLYGSHNLSKVRLIKKA